MFTKPTTALAALMLSFFVFSPALAETAAPVAQEKSMFKVATGAVEAAASAKKARNEQAVEEKNIVKYIDFTKPIEERESSSNAIKQSRTLAKAVTYTVRGKKYRTISDVSDFSQQGSASWYGPGFHGRKTASGEIYDMNALTAAHKRLPLGTRVKVTNLRNGKSVVVRINDRGPFHGNRVLDLSKAAAKKIGVVQSGVADVSIVALK